MKKICIRSDYSGWVIDNISKDFSSLTTHKIVNGMSDNPDIIWFTSIWRYFNEYILIPSNTKIVVSLHHFDESKINEYNLPLLSKVDLCLVSNELAKNSLKKLVNVDTKKLPYWLLSSFLADRDNIKVNETRSSFLTNKQELLIGSFVKDGNGRDGNTPKLSKGPDIFLQIVEKLQEHMGIKVILGAYARNYMIEGLRRLKVPYLYLENYNDINLLYDSLDWYLVTSRLEGGPQSILEASYRKTKILSTDVGIAKDILHKDCICGDYKDFISKIIDNIDRTEDNYNNVLRYLPNKIIPLYDEVFNNL